jgi:potassium-transporting ATPase KdpC subunit
MKVLLTELRTSIIATVVLTIVLSGIYPLLVWGIGQLIFPYQANGSLLEVNRQVVGSSLIAQGFSGAKYFHPRPSAISSYPFDGANSGGSNLGPTSQKLMDTIRSNVAAYRQENQLPANVPVPADAATASASGLDPHISIENANLQAPRVAKTRGLSVDRVHEEISKATDRPWLGFIGGTPGVNVLKLNVALDGVK